jgi:hypothetical protein
MATGFEMAKVSGGGRFECVGTIDNWQAACAGVSFCLYLI